MSLDYVDLQQRHRWRRRSPSPEQPLLLALSQPKQVACLALKSWREREASPSALWEVKRKVALKPEDGRESRKELMDPGRPPFFGCMHEALSLASKGHEVSSPTLLRTGP